ncbi:MAG: phosphatidylserine decarboxylase family protein [Gemmatimonadales bacterium]|nr:phosphatidylserine decarboxylase family protein [Gemmatimonadales bacterium]
MRVAREGWPFILIAAAILVLLAAAGWYAAALIWLPIVIWVIAFFRDPVRDRIRGDDLILAPADGRIVSIISIDEPIYLGGPATRVAIFMNVFNVHVNRYPATGSVEFRSYTEGAFLNAAVEKASTANEQSTIGLRVRQGKLLIRQIAGLVARRIVTDHEAGHHAMQGERLGLIRFGSRVDLFLPPDATLRVKAGDITKAGETVIATWST